MLDRIPQVFISYSWTNELFKQSVEELAQKLMHDGVNVTSIKCQTPGTKL